GLQIDLEAFYRFAKRDEKLGALAQRFRGMKPPRFATVFESVINAIACQQITLTLGIRLLNDLAMTFGPVFQKGETISHSFLRPVVLAGVCTDGLWQMGLSRQKGRAIIDLSKSDSNSHLDIDRVEILEEQEAIKYLFCLRG